MIKPGSLCRYKDGSIIRLMEVTDERSQRRDCKVNVDTFWVSQPKEYNPEIYREDGYWWRLGMWHDPRAYSPICNWGFVKIEDLEEIDEEALKEEMKK